MADDTAKKQDQPSDGASAPDEKVAQEAAEAKAAASQEQAAEDAEAPEPKAKRARKPKAEPEAEGTAAAETSVDKAAAEPAAKAGAQARRRERREQAVPVQTVRAHAKYVRTSARKARLVCDTFRGKTVEEARSILAYTPRAVGRDWAKLLESAVANAEHNHDLVGDDLRVARAFADEGPTLKRFRPRAQGRATPIRKRTSHLTIELTEAS